MTASQVELQLVKEGFLNEAEVESHVVSLLKKSGYGITQRSCRNSVLNAHWPSKNSTIKKVKKESRGYPDILLYEGSSEQLLCVWENKSPNETAELGLEEAKFYIEGLRKALPTRPGLPRFAVGFNGVNLRASVLGNDEVWRPIVILGAELRDKFLSPTVLSLGVNAQGQVIATSGNATAMDLRAILPDLKTLYRTIPKLSSGRSPIDFTVALLTLKLVLELEPEWGYWAEQPRFDSGAKTVDHTISERFTVLAARILNDPTLNTKYGDIFLFKESTEGADEKFDFIQVVNSIQKGNKHFEKIFNLLDKLPPLHGAEFDVFGEVYQALGDEATKKKLGEFFTGRHIISSVLPILFERATLNKSFAITSKKKMADIACGTGGFLTEMLRLTKNHFDLKDAQVSSFAKKAFFGYDLSSSNASRARVNMYFAGDGFSEIRGGVDSLSEASLGENKFDVIATNPPYGQYHGGRIEEAFLDKTLKLIKKGTGWGCIVLPTGTIENPRSEQVRFNLLKHAIVTDVIALPKHAFAPYTQQRTAIIIFNRRMKPLAVESLDWPSLVKFAGKEELNFFIVDNDGFANSDKRYRTSRTDATGAWLHDDISSWNDSKGIEQPSKLFDALIHGKKPTILIDENGNQLRDKFGRFRLEHICTQLQSRSVPLLPDVLLRANNETDSIASWVKKVNVLVGSVKNLSYQGQTSLKESLELLMATELSVAKASKKESPTLSDIFVIQKGNQHLTEATIYKYITQNNGFPVYGGGAKAPRFRVTKDLLRATGEKATLFEGPAIIVAMDGSSGSVQVIESGKFYCNHHGAVLKPKKTTTNLWCIAQLIEVRLRSLASNQGSSATLTSAQLSNLKVEVPNSKRITEIGDSRKVLTAIYKLVS